MTTSETTNVGAAQNALIPGARNLCKDKEPEFGHYSFETREPLNKAENATQQTLILTQEIKCQATVGILSSKAPQPVSDQWKPSKAEEENIQQLTYKYFKKRDTGNYKEAYSIFTASFKASLSEKIGCPVPASLISKQVNLSVEKSQSLLGITIRHHHQHQEYLLQQTL